MGSTPSSEFRPVNNFTIANPSVDIKQIVRMNTTKGDKSQLTLKRVAKNTSKAHVRGVAKTPSFAYHTNSMVAEPRDLNSCQMPVPLFNTVPGMFDAPGDEKLSSIYSDAEEVSLSDKDNDPPAQVSDDCWDGEEEMGVLMNELDRLLEGHEEAMGYTSSRQNSKSVKSETSSDASAQSRQDLQLYSTESRLDDHHSVYGTRKGNTMEPLPGMMPNKVDWKVSTKLMRQEKLLQKKVKIESTKGYLMNLMGTQKWVDLADILATKKKQSRIKLDTGFDAEKFRQANFKKMISVSEINSMINEEPNDSILDFILSMSQEQQMDKHTDVLTTNQFDRDGIMYDEEEVALMKSIRREYGGCPTSNCRFLMK